jgi:hypothetical protein
MLRGGAWRACLPRGQPHGLTSRLHCLVQFVVPAGAASAWAWPGVPGRAEGRGGRQLTGRLRSRHPHEASVAWVGRSSRPERVLCSRLIAVTIGMAQQCSYWFMPARRRASPVVKPQLSRLTAAAPRCRSVCTWRESSVRLASTPISVSLVSLLRYVRTG